MIFYFSGTGNSKYAATQIWNGQEQLYDLAVCCRERQNAFSLEEGERLGFVFPVYYGGLPSKVQTFLKHLQLEGVPAYTFAVITCGAKIFGAGAMLKQRLARLELGLDAVFPLRMPDNYVILYELPSEEETDRILEQSERSLAEIRERIEGREACPPKPGIRERAATRMMYPLYVRGRKTAKFHVTDTCVSCGICAKRCPSAAIELIDGVPTWVKDRCVHCMSCMRCNAIQYGKKTLGRRRHVHPSLKKCH